MSDWQNLPLGGVVPQPGGTTIGGGGGYHSVLDAKRSAVRSGRVPHAEYPDGYLGDVHSRREDRLLKDVQSRLTQRSYQRGVHKGERIDPQDYYWNDVVHPQAGIEAQARGEKWTQQGSTPADVINHMGKNHLLTPEQLADVANGVGITTPKSIDPVRSARMGRLLPAWK